MLAAFAAMVVSRRTARWTRPLLGGAVGVFVILAILPTGYWLSRSLETRFPIPRPLPADIAHIVVLAGAEDLGASAMVGRPEFNAAADRMIEGAALARAMPRARLWIVGGVRARWVLSDVDWTALAWRRLGIPRDRILMARESFDTCENAAVVAARRLQGDILLVTSAIHMPRAVACFRSNGIEPTPYPVDFQRSRVAHPVEAFSSNLSANLTLTDAALHEWIGLLFYRLAGRTEALLPAP
ncbi:MAG: YdcF family protein [Sphingomonadaceae bacterium]|nr:YdcF family protein [Sphingomonadaceae bacterium]